MSTNIYIKHIKMKTIKHARYKQVRDREREREQSQTRDICFEVRAHLLYNPAFTLERFSLKSIPPDHSVPQHLQGVPTRTLELSSPSLVPEHTASPQARRGRTSNSEFTLEPETPRTQPSASSKYTKEVFGDHNTLIT